MNKLKSNFGIIEENDNFILILDRCIDSKSMSITNDAENVVQYLLKNNNVENKTIYYIDTDNRIDILKHNGKKFTGFEPGYDNTSDFKKEHIGVNL